MHCCYYSVMLEIMIFINQFNTIAAGQIWKNQYQEENTLGPIISSLERRMSLTLLQWDMIIEPQYFFVY